MGAFLVPFCAQSAFVILEKSYGFGISWFEGRGSLIISSIAGFVFLARMFRRNAIWIALVYFPLMCFLLFHFSFILVGAVYDDWL